MSNKRRIPNGADLYYEKHLQGTPFRRQPQADTQARYERMHLRTLSELSVNRFNWFGLPEEIDPRFVETTLFYNGFGLFFRDLVYNKFMFTKAASDGRLDFYDNPTSFRAIATNYPSRHVSARKITETAGVGIPIWSNYLRMPDMDIVLLYSSKLAETDQTIDINLLNARQNKYVLSGDKQRLSMDNISREMESGNNNIKVRGSAGIGQQNPLDGVQVVDLGVDPEKVERIHIMRKRLFDEALMYLGIDTANEDKKERLVSAEVDAGADKALLFRYVNLQARQEACEKINRTYKTDIWVEYNTEVDKMVSVPSSAIQGLEDEGYTVNDPSEMMQQNQEESENERDNSTAEASN